MKNKNLLLLSKSSKDLSLQIAMANKYLKKKSSLQTAKAIPFLLAAANRGDSWAEYNLGYSYQEGDGVKKSWRKAMLWYERSASHGYDSAQLNLGILYARRFNDYKKAIKFFLLAAKQGNVNAQYNLGMYYEEGKSMVPRNNRLSFKWYFRAAENGNIIASHKIGYFFHEGIGIRRNFMNAVSWYRKAARQGYLPSMYNLGLCYLEGDGVPKSACLAIKWLKSAAIKGHVLAKKKLMEFQ